MPDDELVRSTLRDEWHLAPQTITALPGTVVSHCWEVAVADEEYVCRLSALPVRGPVEAGLAAAGHLRGRGIAAGDPVRTLGGKLTVPTDEGVLSVLRRPPGRRLDGADPVDQQWWGDRLGAVHRALQGFHHPGLGPWQALDADAAHLAGHPWLREAVTGATTATTRLTVTDRLTYGVLLGDPAPGAFVVDPATGKAGVLDCGASGTGPLVYDVAAAIIHAGGPERAAELVDGYLAAGPVGADELEAALPVLLRLGWAVRAFHAARRGCADHLQVAREALESASY